MSKKAQEKSIEFDIDKNVNKYIEYFRNVKIKEIKLTEKEKEESARWNVKEENLFKQNKVNTDMVSKKRRVYQKMLKIFPKGLKTKVKKFLLKLVQE